MKILLGDLNEKLEREYISKPKICNGKLHEDDNDVRIVNYTTSK
jgi:hypothetical protein